MKSQILKALVIIAIAGQLACQSKKDSKLELSKTSKIVSANANMSSEELTDAAEQLLTPTQFMHADKILDLALEKDPENLKAQFYKNFLKGFVANKGILTRIKPLVRQYGNITEYEKSISSMPNVHLKKFLTAGNEDMTSVKDIQNWFSDYQLALNDFRKFLIVNQNATLTLELNAQALEASLKDPNSYNCENVSTGDGNYTFKCDMTEVGHRTLTTPDLIAIRQMTAGWILYLNFFTAYSFEGVEMFKTVELKPNTSAQEIEKLISEKMPAFGKLRQNHLLKEVVPMGSDFVNAGRWVIQYQNQICPQGVTKPQQRKGALFHEGLCVSDANQALKSLALVEQVLTQRMKVDFGTQGEKVEVDYMALFNNPVENLLSLTPATYDSCGQAITLKDPSFGGMFPNKDAEKFLTHSKTCNTAK